MPRKTIYERDGWNEKLEVIKGWARDGLTDEQIAGKMGIGVTTLYDYKKKYSEFLKALKKGKEIVDRKVESSLLKRALGYDVKETKKESIYNKKTGEYEMVTTEIKTKHIHPDTTAQIFWLKNRLPDKWRDKHEIDQNINNITGVEIEFIEDD